MSALPLVNRRIIEALLDAELHSSTGRRLVLVSARYEDTAPREFTALVQGRPRRVRVDDERSVLGIADAWQRHLAECDDDGLLVITSDVPATQLGWDLRAHAVGRRSLTVDRVEIVKQLFGATDLDPRIIREGWLLDALLDAEPVNGWPRAGAVLTLDAAVRALVAVRLGLNAQRGGDGLDLDADALLGWSRTATGPARYAELPEAERAGLTEWLVRAVGASAATLLALAADGRGQDAMALGVLSSVLTLPGAPAGASFALGGLFGSSLSSPDTLAPFTDAVTGTLTRWIAEAEGNGEQGAEARQRVFSVLDRADQLSVEAGLAPALRTDPMLPSGFRNRLADLATALGDSTPAAEAALEQVLAHHLSALYPDSCEAARMAVRIMRWLDEPAPGVESVAQAVSEQVAQWGWADRALTLLSAGDLLGGPPMAEAYHRLIARGRERRTDLDRQFAHRLAAWTAAATSQTPGGCLLIEDVLATVAAPLAGQAPPLVLVLDGMSSAVAVQLGDELDRRAWTEIVPRPPAATAARRLAAVSMLPSITTVSRASLLTGEAARGGQDAEAAGFAAFWQRRRRTGLLFHKGDIAGVEGHRLAPELLSALAGDSVVGVVLNSVDDALDHGRQGEHGAWRLGDVSHLPDLLGAARGHGRPVVLVSDHGHVVDRSAPGQGPVSAPGAQSARWRTGRPGDGEVELSGPRVLEGGGTVVAPWREDIRYTPRKAGYHGGAALAEVAVPVIVLVPSPELAPADWVVLPAERIVPSWWHRPDQKPAPEAAAPTRRPRGRPTAQQGESLFAETLVATADKSGTLGSRVVDSAQYRTQKAFVRRSPDAKAVAAVIDALTEAGGRLSPEAVATAASATGRPQRNAEIFVTVVQRLLNIEGYPVLSLVDSGRTVELNIELLCTQFGVEK